MKFKMTYFGPDPTDQNKSPDGPVLDVEKLANDFAALCNKKSEEITGIFIDVLRGYAVISFTDSKAYFEKLN